MFAKTPGANDLIFLVLRSREPAVVAHDPDDDKTASLHMYIYIYTYIYMYMNMYTNT